jgi:galactonate dehydratase
VKMTSVETFHVPPRWLFVKISTDDGLTGWGEATLEGRAATVAQAVQEHVPYLLGKDPLRVQEHWQVMSKSTFYRGGPVLSSAVAGIDLALWDILGHALQVPVHTLLGGAVRERTRMYCWVGGDDPAELGEGVAAAREAGFSAVKFNASGAQEPIASSAAIDRVLSLAASARDAAGPDMDIALDFHGRFTTATARRALSELEPLRPFFVEEPLLPEFSGVRLSDITAATNIPIACGERLFNRASFLPALQAGIAVAQPDVSHCGGISEALRIASLAEIYDVLIAPHCPLGPIALAASLQCSVVTPNFLIQEQSGGIHYNKGADLLDYIVDTSVFDFSSGYCARLQGPGLGIQVDEAAVRKAAEQGPNWQGPTWRHADGSFAEW